MSGHPTIFQEKTSKPGRSRKTHKGVKATRENFCADFETTTTADDCRVWSWGIANVLTPMYDDVVIGTDIDSFMEHIKQQNSVIYFHNLRFDGAFILDWLLNHDYYHITERELYVNETFKTLISDMGKFYSITVRWDTGHSTEFRDSLKKLPMGVRRVAQSFHLDMAKGDIDYEAYRPIGHVITPEEEDYLRRDVSIMAQAMNEVISSGMKKLTVASDAMAEFRDLTGLKHFTNLFPVFSSEMDADIRRAYRGGFTYSDPRFRGRKLDNGIVLDVNSLYPSVMRSKVIPYGTPEYVEGRVEPTENKPLIIFSVTFTAKIKPDHIPCIQIKGNNMFLGTEYLTSIDEPTTLMVTNVDWELYNDHYDIEVLSYNDGYRFHGMRGMFDSYIDKWSAVKAKEKGGKREIAKLHLNSLYGKFASNPNVTGKIPVLEDGVVKLKRGVSETRDPVYTAAGAFITAYARDITIRAAQANYENFAYADTDSLHLTFNEEWDGVYVDPKTGEEFKVPASINIHPTELGAWKFEYAFKHAWYIRPKAYLEQIGGDPDAHDDTCAENCTLRHDYVNRIAGLPLAVSGALKFEDLKEGLILHGKLNPKTVPGGVVLKDVPFELKLS